MALPSSLKVATAIDEAFERIGLDPSAIVAAHIRSAQRSIRLLLDDWSTDGVHLWKVTDTSQVLTIGDGTYNAPAGTIDLLEASYEVDDVETRLNILTHRDWNAIPDKTVTGTPDRIWLQRTATTMVLNVWPLPDAAETLVYSVIVGFDDSITLASAADIPSFWNEAFVAGLTAKLAEKYAPERLVEKQLLYGGPGEHKGAYARAKIQGRERGDLRLVPTRRRR